MASVWYEKMYVIQWPSRQAGRQAGNQAGKQAGKPTVNQAIKQASRQASRQAIAGKQAGKQARKQSSRKALRGHRGLFVTPAAFPRIYNMCIHFHELCKQKGMLRHITTIYFEKRYHLWMNRVLIKYLFVRQDNHNIFRQCEYLLVRSQPTRIASLMNVDEMTFSLRCLDSCSFIKTFSPFCLGDFHGKLQCLISSCYAGS